MRIGIDARRLGPHPKGIGRYVWELCRGLDQVLPTAEFFLYALKPPHLPAISRRWSIRVDDSPLGRRLPNTLWLVARAGLMSRQDRVDVFWAGTGLLPLVGLKSRAVLTVHDVVERVAPQTMDRNARWGSRLFFERSLARADAIVSNSAGTAERLKTNFGYPVAAVVRPGISEVFRPHSEQSNLAVLAHYQVNRPYLLSVSTWEPRKGLEQLIHAFLRMKSEGLIPDHKLVLVGERGWKDSAIVELARKSEAVVSLGFVEDASLAALYSGAEAFVYPSQYEGFGMPVLEARACGTRVVTTDLPELREAGGEDAIYISPTEEGIRSGIAQALAAAGKPINWRDWNWAASASILAKVLLDSVSVRTSKMRPRDRGEGAKAS
ncbi:MAG: glycosyltransferase family 4 protein [Deltaproteobacteria bacterium]|nr:glycosyltransferase family 4 protein [Deltaproteobacteria bacterium]